MSRFVQGAAAVWAINVAKRHAALTMRTHGLQAITAARAETESGLNRRATLWAGSGKRFTQDEVQDDAESVGNEERDQRPQHPAHTAPAGIAVHVSDQQEVAGHDRPDKETEKGAHNGRWRIGVTPEDDKKPDLRSQKADSR